MSDHGKWICLDSKKDLKLNSLSLCSYGVWGKGKGNWGKVRKSEVVYKSNTLVIKICMNLKFE